MAYFNIAASAVGFHPVCHHLVQNYVAASADAFEGFQFQPGDIDIAASDFHRQPRHSLRYSDRQCNVLPVAAEAAYVPVGDNGTAKQGHLHQLFTAVSLIPAAFPALYPRIKDAVFFMLEKLVIQLVAYSFCLVVHMDFVVLGAVHNDIRHLAVQYDSLIVRRIGKAFLQIRIPHILPGFHILFPVRFLSRIQLRKSFGKVLLGKLPDHLFDIAQLFNNFLFRPSLALSLHKMLPVVLQDLFLQFLSKLLQLLLKLRHIFQLRHGLIPPVPESTG